MHWIARVRYELRNRNVSREWTPYDFIGSGSIFEKPERQTFRSPHSKLGQILRTSMLLVPSYADRRLTTSQQNYTEKNVHYNRVFDWKAKHNFHTILKPNSVPETRTASAEIDPHSQNLKFFGHFNRPTQISGPIPHTRVCHPILSHLWMFILRKYTKLISCCLQLRPAATDGNANYLLLLLL